MTVFHLISESARSAAADVDGRKQPGLYESLVQQAMGGVTIDADGAMQSPVPASKASAQPSTAGVQGSEPNRWLGQIEKDLPRTFAGNKG